MGNRDLSTPEKQALIMWALLVRDGSAAFQNELKPEPNKADRDALEKAGLIASRKEGPNRRFWLEVTEKGWDWAAAHLDQKLPSGSKAGSAILRAWLIRLKAYMNAGNVSLAEVLRPQRARHSAASELEEANPTSLRDRNNSPHDDTSLRERIRHAYLAVTGNRLNTRARLAELREKLSDIDRAALDDALKRMQREEYGALYPLDNKAEITPADRDAAIYFGEEPRHILWLP